MTDDLIHRYSRRGNFHTDAAQSESLGLPGLVAQGTQAAGRSFGLLLAAWGEDFIAHGSLDLKFVGMVVGGDEISTTVTINDATAEIHVVNETRARVAVVGSACVVATEFRYGWNSADQKPTVN